jgi:hypothetical protein
VQKICVICGSSAFPPRRSLPYWAAKKAAGADGVFVLARRPSGSREPTTRRGGRVPPMYCAVRGGSSSPNCPPWRKLDANQSLKVQPDIRGPEQSTTRSGLIASRVIRYQLLVIGLNNLSARFSSLGSRFRFACYRPFQLVSISAFKVMGRE